MKKYTLTAQERTVVGRKVKNLRAQGQLPATVYGKSGKSVSIAVAKDAFTDVYKKAGETGLVELAVGTETKPVLIHTVQLHPVSSQPLHVEFHQVDLKEKVHANVPLEFVGEAPAVAQKLGVLLTVLDEIEVEALPAELPENITVDISGLAEVNQELKVSDLKIPSGVVLLTDSGLTVVKVGPLVTREAAQMAAEEKAAAEAKAAAVAPQEEGAPEATQAAEKAPAPEPAAGNAPAKEKSESKG